MPPAARGWHFHFPTDDEAVNLEIDKAHSNAYAPSAEKCFHLMHTRYGMALGHGFFTDEGCFITEILNDGTSPGVSIARARVEPGMQTELHTLDVAERYVILQGTGLMTIGRQAPFPVREGDSPVIPAGIPQRIKNTGTADLVFLCICTPRFSPKGYTALEPYVRD